MYKQAPWLCPLGPVSSICLEKETLLWLQGEAGVDGKGARAPGQSLAPRPGGRDWIQIHFQDQMRSPRSGVVTALFPQLPLLLLLLSPRDVTLEQIYLLGTYGSVGVKQ